MKALITGMTGMIGKCFAEVLRERGWTVSGIARASASSRTAVEPIGLIRADCQDAASMEEIFQRQRPDLVVHLAAQAFNGASWECEELTHDTNVRGTLNVLRACRKLGTSPKVLLACSSAEYGDVPREEQPLREDRALRPVSPYGVSKAASEQLGFQYFRNYSIPVYLPRLFIHLGTGHPPFTAVQNFAKQLALVKLGRVPPVLRTGNLDTARDFIDVRDGVKAMLTLLERGDPGTPVNICTGKAHKLSDMLVRLIEISGQKVELQQDAGLCRPSDETLLLGDPARIQKLGWSQVIPLERTLSDIWADWEMRVNR